MMRKLFNKYRCDKGSKHGYEAVYEPDFEPLKNEPINILEIGIFKGQSTKAWLDYFPNATIYGIDIFTRVNPDDVDALKHERVKYLKANSMQQSVAKKIENEWPDVEFDIIIDDGKHTPEANRLSFENTNRFLKPDGAYYIEDVFPIDKMSTKEMSIPWIQNRQDDYNMFEFLKFERALDGWTIQRYDLRKKSGEPDSYIVKVTR